jgi:hypothetical protein
VWEFTVWKFTVWEFTLRMPGTRDRHCSSPLHRALSASAPATAWALAQ